MRIGVVSDTHNRIPNVARLVALFREARVERIVHTGDITQARTLRLLAGVGVPLLGVFGNNDQERESLRAACSELALDFVDPPRTLCLAGRRVAVVHDPRDLSAELLASCDLALHGHDHRYRAERIGETLVFNPGECAGHIAGANAVGVVDLRSLATELLRF